MWMAGDSVDKGMRTACDRVGEMHVGDSVDSCVLAVGDSVDSCVQAVGDSVDICCCNDYSGFQTKR